MHANAIRIIAKRDDARAVAPGMLAHLSELGDDYMIVDPIPDFRDWKAIGPDGRPIGKVDDIIVDTSTMTVDEQRVVLAYFEITPAGAPHG